MKTQAFVLSLLLVLLSAASCNKDADGIEKEIKLTLKSQQIVEADNEFGLDIFKRIYENEEEPNFMISPLSISMALAMTYNGAETETKAQMAEALKIDKFTRDELNATYKQLMEALGSIDPKVVLEIANSIWYRDTYPVEEAFLNVNSAFYNAEVNAANFENPETVDLINQWVSDKTHEKIPFMLENIPPDAVMYLINAIYFYGNWATEFNPESTREGSFDLGDNNYVSVDMMNRIDTVNYLSNDVFSAIELPYGKGNFNMTLLLPAHNKKVNDVVTLLNTKNWKKWQNEFVKTNSIDIKLPKFKIEYKISLNDFLADMGMELAFSDYADFSGINKNRNLFISRTKHKTFIEVDEEGTEAAAATMVEMSFTSFDPNAPQYIPFHCNRPFLFVINEKDTGAILFMGKVGNPKEE